MRAAKPNTKTFTRDFLACLGMICLLILQVTSSAVAGDWPQILGPQRNGKAEGERLEAWKQGGPALLWSRAVGEGFAGVAVAGQRAILFHRPDADLVAEALDVNTGDLLWKATFATRFRGSISPDSGPRCVPLVHENRVYLVGPGGELACVAIESGKIVWTRNLPQDFRAQDGYFGFGSTPMIAANKLLLNVGGRKGGIVAFSLDDGKTLWTAGDDDASYSSPILTTIHGVQQAIFVTRLTVTSVDPRDGKVLFEFPFGQRGPTVNAATPLVLEDHLFVSASYGVGARWVKLGVDRPVVEWDSDDVMSSQYTTCIEHDGALYGIDGRQDIGVARLRAFDPKTRKIFWTDEGFGTGHLILAGDTILVMKTDGKLVLFAPSPKRYEPLAEAQLFDTTVQALPALADGRLFARDTRMLKCVRVGRQPAAE
jgi:hypothetical protein